MALRMQSYGVMCGLGASRNNHTRRRKRPLPLAYVLFLAATQLSRAFVTTAPSATRGPMPRQGTRGAVHIASESFVAGSTRRVRMAAAAPAATARGVRRKQSSTYSSTTRRAPPSEAVSVEAILQQHGVLPPRDEISSYRDARGEFVELSAEQEADAIASMQNAAALLEVRQELKRKSGVTPSLQTWAVATGRTVAALTDELAAAAAAKRNLVASHIPLVLFLVQRNYAWRLRHVQMSRQDMIQEGTCGLIRAAEMFVPDRGVRFRTYAWRAVKSHIDQAIYNSGRLVRVPKAVAQRALKQSVTPEGGKSEAKRAVDVTTRMISLDRTISSGELLRDVLPVPGAIEGYENESGSLVKDLRRVIEAALTPREQLLLSMRFGLQDDRPLTLKECAEKMYLSTEQVRRLTVTALAKLREHIESGEGDASSVAIIAFRDF